MSAFEEQFLVRAIQLATENVHDDGGPFGALIATDSGRTFEGTNRVTAHNDPTAHAEVMAIRNACSSLRTFDLTGCMLYTSCEPCPLCLAAALWARVGGIVFAADRHDAARAGFDDALFYEFFEAPVEDRSMQVRQLVLPDSASAAPFDAWAALANRTDY
ncbi:nucleoside deaminase [Arthrobacter tecti]